VGKVVPIKRERISFEPGPKFEAAWKAFPERGRVYSSRRQAAVPWAQAAALVGEERLLAAVMRFAASSPDPRYVAAFHRWLDLGRYEHWVDLEQQASRRATAVFPDPTLRESFRARFAADEPRRWFDACLFDPETREVTASWRPRAEWAAGPFKLWAIANDIAGLFYR
jgi:hypothetical protein